MLQIGDIAPALTIPTYLGQFSLTEQIGKKVVIFFFPRASTSTCTNEAVQFSSLSSAFAAENAIVIGISKDPPVKLEKFRLKHHLTCQIGADHETNFCEQFGVWVKKSMYGKKFMGIQRSSFIIDVDGRIAARWSKVRVNGHAQDVLETIKSL